MALNTKTISVGCDNNYTLELRLTETGTSAADNTSAVNWALVLVSRNVNFGDYRIGWSVSLDGSVVSSRAWDATPSNYCSISKYSELTVAAGTRTVPHGDDGGKTLSASASMTIPRGSVSPAKGSSGTGTFSLSGSMALTAIARASTLTAFNGTLGKAQTLTVNRAVAAYTHTLTYVCGAASGTIAAKTASTSLTWTPPLALAAQNTTGASVSVQLTLITFHGSSEVGRTARTLSMAIPASVKPTASAAVEVVNSNATVDGWGVAVKGYSKYRVTTSFTGAQGSTFGSRSVKVQATGETLTDSPVTTRALASTNRTVKVQVTDSRGRVGETTVTGPVIYDYGSPTISRATAIRCDESGAADESGAYLRVCCTGDVSSCGGHNAATVQVRRRASGGSWSGWTTLTGGTAQTLNAGLSAAASYEVQFRVTDSLGASRTVTVSVPTAQVTFHLRAGGSGAAFGKYAEKDDTLQLAWDLELPRPLAVLQGGTGQAAAWRTVAVTPAATLTDSSFTCRYYPYLGMVFLRGNGKLAAASAANTWFTAASIPQEFLPAQTAAVTLSVPGGGSGLARYTGSLELRTFTDRAVGTSLDLTGWWFV